MPKISVMIPAYNADAYLGATLEAVLTNRTPIEIIIVDDNSTDRTLDVANSYQRRHSNITVIRNTENLGAGVSRNTAIKLATGQYYYFLDADDILQSGALDILAMAMDETGCDVIHFKHQYLTSETDVTTDMYPQDIAIWNSIVGSKPFGFVDIANSGQILLTVNYPWNKIIRADFCKATNFAFSTALVHEDIYPHWHSYFFARKILLLNRSLIVHREIAGRQQHTNIFDARRLEVFKAFADVENLFARQPALKENHYHWFLCFKLDLLKWIAHRLDKKLMDQFFNLLAASYQPFDDAEFHRVYGRMRDMALTSLTLKYAPYKIAD